MHFVRNHLLRDMNTKILSLFIDQCINNYISSSKIKQEKMENSDTKTI